MVKYFHIYKTYLLYYHNVIIYRQTLIKLGRGLKLDGLEPLFANWVTEDLHIIMNSAVNGMRAGLHGGEKTQKVKIEKGIVIGVYP